MKVIDHFEELGELKWPVVTSGTFDGVHSGHLKILEGLVSQAKLNGGESVVITYWPHPKFILGKGTSTLKLLSTFDEKVALMDKIGVDYLLKVRFSKEFSELTPEAFVQKVLISGLRIRKFLIGYDHRFGKNQLGDIQFLTANKDRFGFDVAEISRLDIDQIGVSSTKIRSALFSGDVVTAKHYLGRYFSLSGIVTKGAQIGRKLGFPTANIFIPEIYKLIPADGVYAVFVSLELRHFEGMLNIGVRPTLNGNLRTIEVNIFDFNEDIYGNHLSIEFVGYIRHEIKFNHLNDLKIQLAIDKSEAKKILGINRLSVK
ncbi:MAG: bifunctional riboflavin kinase/FAD synthetase [Flammeovirgaceae bacterium]|jgi:riboflavin kinase / FMN adenylyltransferase|nr:bifunctional riboflavin kinase/FAD synthetase [Flammeovirgaceae bacterium]|tara:strand:- start:4340 stop:5287 length:948 start_codon:yes stop_codon:yes gene_type:complete